MKPFSHRLIEMMPMPAYLTGLLVSCVCFTGYFLIELNAGVVEKTLSGEIASIALRASLMLMVLIGYLPIAHWYLRKWTWEHIGELNTRFHLQDQRRIPREVTLIPVGLSGSFAFVFLFLVLPDPTRTLFQPWNWPLDFVLLVAAISLAGWWMGRFSYELIWSALQLTNLAKRLPKLNLLDTESHRPFTQHGVQNALLVVIMMSIMAPVVVQPGGGIVGAAINSALMLVLATMGLILPMRGVHQRIQIQKREELAAIRSQIQDERMKLLAVTDVVDHRLVALLAMEVRIERAEEWPFGVGSLSRVAFYLLLGLGSWVGAALVERLMESAL
jgi:hypothetical protein